LINLPDGGLDLVSLICRDRPTFGPSGWNSAPHYSRHFLHCVSLPSFPIDSRPLTAFVLSLLPRPLSSLSVIFSVLFFHSVISSFFISFLTLSNLHSPLHLFCLTRLFLPPPPEVFPPNILSPQGPPRLWAPGITHDLTVIPSCPFLKSYCIKHRH
jgi:hypothetical protein